MTQALELLDEVLDRCAKDNRAAVALSLAEELVPVEGRGTVFFPPTYADIGYNIDTLGDGTKVVTIDSVGSQANRMEPLFKASEGEIVNPLAKLVPQVNLKVTGDQTLSLFDVGHRLGDAVIRASTLAAEAQSCFRHYLKTGDANPIAKIAPTTAIFGAWDSRDTQAKLPRIVQSVIRAHDVDDLRRSAIYTPPLDYAALDVFSDEDKQKFEVNKKSPVAQRGFVHVPSNDAPGGVIARGPIVRNVTINLVALRRLAVNDDAARLRMYLLGLALVVAADPGEAFLRQGCLLVPDTAKEASWILTERNGHRAKVNLTPQRAFEYAVRAADAYGVGPDRNEEFSKDRAKKDVEDAKKSSTKKSAKA